MVTDNKYHGNVSLKMVSVLGEMGEDAFCQGEGWMFSGLRMLTLGCPKVLDTQTEMPNRQMAAHVCS